MYCKIFSTKKTLLKLSAASCGECARYRIQLLRFVGRTGAVAGLFRHQRAGAETVQGFSGDPGGNGAGSTNACEQELVALGNAFYDVERFGIHFVASPRHADMLMVRGPVSRNMREALARTYEAMPDPKTVVAVGDDAIDGGVFRGSYAVLDGAHNVVPVHYQIPGDPPAPEKILCSLLEILHDFGGRLTK